MTAANLNITIDRSADWSKVITITDSGDDPVALTAAVAGVKQVETATTSGTVSAGGVVAVSFVSALTGTVSKLVTVTAGDTPTVTNAKICQSFNADPVFSAYFKATYSTGSLIATALAAAANDSTVNWSVAGSGTTATGVSAAATSANTTAGVAQVFGLASFKGQLSVRQGSPSIAEFRFEIISGGDGNQVRVVLPRSQTANLSPDQKYHFDWFADISTSRARHIQGTASVRGSSTVFGTTLLPAQSSTPVTPPSSSATWGGITGTLSDQTDLQSALDGKLATAGTAADVNPVGTSIASALSGKETAGAAATAQAFAIQRANHTGTQAQSTIVNLVSDLAGKASLAGNNTFTGQQEFTDTSTFLYTATSRANHLSSLGAGTTGSELFGAATAAAARTTLMGEILKYDPNDAATRTNPAAYADDDTLAGINLTVGMWEISWYAAFDTGCGVNGRLRLGTSANVDILSTGLFGVGFRGTVQTNVAYVSATGELTLGNTPGTLGNWALTGNVIIKITGNTTLALQYFRNSNVGGATIIRRAGAFLRARKIN